MNNNDAMKDSSSPWNEDTDGVSSPSMPQGLAKWVAKEFNPVGSRYAAKKSVSDQ